MSLLAPILALLLALAPALAFAGGATDTLLLSTPPASVTYIYTGHPPSQIISYPTAATSSPRTGSFVTAPAVGDLLLAYCPSGWGQSGGGSSVGLWTQFESIGGTGSGFSTGGHSWYYLYVIAGSVTAYTPCVMVNDHPVTAGNVSTVIYDIPAAGVAGVWATDFRGFVGGGALLTSQSWSLATAGGAHNTLVLAGTSLNCSSGTVGLGTLTLTGGVTQGLQNDSATAFQIAVGAWAGDALGATTFNSTATFSGSGCSQESIVWGSVTINGH